MTSPPALWEDGTPRSRGGPFEILYTKRVPEELRERGPADQDERNRLMTLARWHMKHKRMTLEAATAKVLASNGYTTMEVKGELCEF